MERADSDIPAVKTEPGSPGRGYDESEPLFSDANVKTEKELPNAIIKKESAYPEWCVEFEPTSYVEKSFQYTDEVKDCPETRVKVEKQVPSSTELGPGSSYKIGEKGAGDVKRDSKNTNQRTERTDLKLPLDAPTRSRKTITSPAKVSSATHTVAYTGQQQFSCSQCTYVCNKVALLKRHMLIHTRGKLYSCSLCAYSCNHKGDLRSHILTHTGEKPFSCSNCIYTCNRKSRLRTHMLTHTGEKPFSCSQCTYTCSQRGHLRIHMLTHTREKPFSCSECTYTCSQNSHLRRHMLIHTGEKSISCSHCSYKCCANGSLKRHMLTHIGKKPFSC